MTTTEQDAVLQELYQTLSYAYYAIVDAQDVMIEHDLNSQWTQDAEYVLQRINNLQAKVWNETKEKPQP